MKQLNKKNKEFRDADKIIQFLIEPGDDTIDLPEDLKKKYLILKEVHGYRLRFRDKQKIVKLLDRNHNLSERQAYNYINETEYVFGKVGGVDKDYERQFLLTVALRNIQLAIRKQDNKAINSAIITYHMVAGLDKDDSNMPDFSKLEQHIYNITLPATQEKFLKKLLDSGTVDLATILPSEVLQEGSTIKKDEST